MLQKDPMDEILEQFTSWNQVQSALDEEADAENEGAVDFKTFPKPQRELDLHGMTGEEAQQSTRHFLKSAHHQNLQTVRIITGKGLHSKQGKSVLRQVAEGFLADLKQQKMILGFKWEKGKGSVLVYLV